MNKYNKLYNSTQKGEYYNRIENYFKSLDNDTLKEYHRSRGSGKK